MGVDRHLLSAQRRAEADAAAHTSTDSAIDHLLSAMGGKKVRQPPAPFAARVSGVGESVWDPVPVGQNDHTTNASLCPSPAVEILRGRAFRKLQAAAEAAFLAELGDGVCAKLELLSRVTLRNGNGLMDRW